MLRAVGLDAPGEERRPAVENRLLDGVDALNAEEGVLLAREARLGQVLRRCRAAHGDNATQLLIRIVDGRRHLGRQRIGHGAVGVDRLAKCLCSDTEAGGNRQVGLDEPSEIQGLAPNAVEGIIGDLIQSEDQRTHSLSPRQKK